MGGSEVETGPFISQRLLAGCATLDKPLDFTNLSFHIYKMGKIIGIEVRIKPESSEASSIKPGIW